MQPDKSDLKPVLGAKPGYYVDREGNVYSTNRAGTNGALLKLKPVHNGRGYTHIVIRMADGKAKTYQVHAIVLDAFVGPKPEGLEARHHNNVRDDNRLDNLSWATRSVNNLDKHAHGTMPIGEKHSQAKLTESQVKELRRKLHKGSTFAAISEEYGITHVTAARIYRGILWSHVPLDYVPTEKRPGGRIPAIPDSTIRTLRLRALEESNFAVLGKEFKLTRSQVRDICNRRTYKHVI